MRADNNWEDEVGKRLFDFEGDLSPQAWENINRRIQPQRKPWWHWLWLPALLLFVALPIAFYLKSKPAETKLAGNQIETPQPESTRKNASGTSGSMPAATQQQPETATATPSDQPSANAQPSNNQAVTPMPATAQPAPAENLPAKVKPGNQVAIQPGLLAAAEKEEATEKENGRENRRKTALSKGLIVAANTKTNSPKTVGNSAEKLKPDSKANASTTKQTAAINSSSLAVNNSELNKAAGQEKTDLAVKSSQNEAAKSANNIAGEVTIAASKEPETQTQNSGLQPATEQVKPTVAADSVKEKNVLASVPLTTTDSAAATPETKPENLKKWKFSLYGTPQYTFQHVHANKTDDVMILRMNNVNEIESERLGYEFGFSTLYPLSEKVELEAGFHFARLNQYLNFTTASPEADSTFIQQANGNLLLQINHHEQNEILLFKYYFGGAYLGSNVAIGKQWHVAAGIGTNWLLWKNPDEETIPVATRNFNPYVSAGLRYYRPLSNSVTLTMGPTLQYYIRAVQKESAYYGSQPTTIGFSFGLLLHGK